MNKNTGIKQMSWSTGEQNTGIKQMPWSTGQQNTGIKCQLNIGIK